MRALLCSLVVPLVFCVPAVAHAEAARPRPTVEIVGMVSELDNGEAHGVSLDAGARLGLGRYFALGFDVGYGVMTGARDVQDRWWMIPTASMVVPSGDLRLELGAGVGLAAASGYADLDAFGGAPFDPVWAFQLAPAIRLHVSLGVRVAEGCVVFARLDAGSLILAGNTIGFREGNAAPRREDEIWVTPSLGASFAL